MTDRVQTKTTDFRSIVVRADPDWSRDRRNEIEYEFSTRAGNGDERVHEGGRRVFRGNPATRGPYGE